MDKNMKTADIFVMLPFTDEDREKLAQSAPGCKIIYGSDPSLGADAEIIIGQYPADRLSEAKHLRLLQLSFAGADPFVKPGVFPATAILTNATGAYGLAISEYMVGAVLTLGKKFNLYRDNMRDHRWKDRGEVMSVYGSTVLTVGLGDIGGEFARLMKAFGVYNIGVRRTRADKPDYVDELVLADKLDEVIPRADIIALAMPGGQGTAGIISRKRIELMKPTSLLINVGRGGAVDTEALCDAIETGKLGGAALDVTDPEPLPPEHRLWNYENVMITPHVSGFYHHPATFGKIVDICVENVRNYLQGKPLRNVIDMTTGYVKH